MATQYPQIQGEYVSWANIRAAAAILSGEVFLTKDFSKIDWKDALSPEFVRGLGPLPVGRTVGEYTAEGSIGMYATSARRFMDALSRRKTAIGLVEFNLLVSYEPLTSGSVVDKAFQAANRVDVVLEGCRIMERSGSNAPGSAASVIEIPLSIMRVKINKRVLV